MSQAVATNGRRTPLSLSQPSSGNNNSKKNKSKPSTPIPEVVETPQVNVGKEVKTSPAELVAKETAQIPDTRANQQKSAEAVEPSPNKTKEEVVEKKSEKKDTNGTHKKETNGDSVKVVVAEESKANEEKPKSSPRHSPRINIPKKNETVAATATDAATVDLTGEDDKEISDALKAFENSTEVFTPENEKNKKADKSEKEKVASAQHSLLFEKELKGFNEEGEEMESLIVEGSEYEDSPMPARAGKGKLLKLSAGPPLRSRVSPFRRSERIMQENISTIVNLSTVSEAGVETPPSPRPNFGQPFRSITGRRSTRTIQDIDYTYRKATSYMNDSLSSLNVTVGSEIHNESFRTPVVPAIGNARKRKDMTPESTSDAMEEIEANDSPKRARLDFSGFLGIVASPVTMLKNRFSRVKIQSSTPNSKLYEANSLDEVSECVTAEATTTTNISTGGVNKMDVENVVDDESADVSVAVEANKNDSKLEDVDLKIDDSNSDVQVRDVTDKRQWCNIM